MPQQSDNFDKTLKKGSENSEFQPRPHVWSGISNHFDKIDRLNKIKKTIFVTLFISSSLISIIYYHISLTNNLQSFSQNKTNIKNKSYNNITEDFFKKKSSNTQTLYNKLETIFSPEKENKILESNNITSTSNNILNELYPAVAKPLHVNNIYNQPNNFKLKKLTKHSNKIKNIEIGLSIGLINNIPTGNQLYNYDKIYNLNSIQVGFNLIYHLNKKFLFNIGASIYNQGVKYQTQNLKQSLLNTSNNSSIVDVSSKVIDIPLSVGYKINLNPKNQMVIYGGTSLSIKLPTLNDDLNFHQSLSFGNNYNMTILAGIGIQRKTKYVALTLNTQIRKQIFNTTANEDFKLIQTGINFGISYPF